MRIAIGSVLLMLILTTCTKIDINSSASMKHSFYFNGQYHESNELIVINRNYRYSESEFPPEKYCGFTFLLIGTALTNNATEQHPLVTFNISLNTLYHQNELEPGCFCLPKTTAGKLYEVLASPEEWNVNNSHKYLYVFRQPGFDYLGTGAYGAKITSKRSGNNLVFIGHIDSLVSYSSNTTQKIYDFDFEYFVPAI